MPSDPIGASVREPSSQPFRFDTGSVVLAGERWGGDDDERAAVLFLHGGGQTRHSWDRTARRVASSGRETVVLDARGHGDSEWAREQDYSLDAFVGDLVAFLRTQERPPVLVGASLGGMSALVAAGDHPDLVSGLVLVDIVVQIEPEGAERIQAFMRGNPDGFASLEEVADAISAYNPLRKRPSNLDGLRKNVRLGPDGRWRWHWDPAFMRIGNEPQREIDPSRLALVAEKVKAPTLIVHGDSSDVVGQAGIDDMLQRIPQAELASVAAAGHMVAGDDNDVFADVLERFLQRL